MAASPPTSLAARDAQSRATLNVSRVFVAGPVLNPRTPDEARTQVAGVAAQKADLVKIRVDDNLGTAQKMAPEVYRAVIDEAHKRGMRVAVHLFYLSDAKEILASGGDLVAHSVRDANVDDAVIAALKSRGVCVVPMLMREVSTFVYESTPEWFSDPLFTAHANPEWVAQGRDPARQQAVRNSASARRYKVALDVASRNVKRVSDAARCLKVDREVGTLEAGKWADFVVLASSLLANISNVRTIASVWIAGNKVTR